MVEPAAEPARQRRALSVSQINAFHECRWAYRELNLRRYPAPRPDYLDLGTQAHELVQSYLLHLVAQQREQDEAAVPRLLQEWSARSTTPVPSDDYATLGDILARFARWFRLEWRHVWDPEAGMSVTWEGEPCEWDDWDRVWFRGKSDLVLLPETTKAVVMDWKSGWHMLTDREMQTDLQPRTYATILRKINPAIECVRVTNYYLRWGIERTAEFDVSTMDSTWGHLRGISDQVERMIDRLNDNRTWTPQPGVHCAGCRVRARCPVGKNVVPEVAVTSLEEAQQAAGLRQQYLARANQIQDQLRAWVDANGPVPIPGAEVGYVKLESWTYDAEKVARLATEHDVDPFSVLRVDAAEMKKVVRRHPEFGQAVEGVREDAGLVRFETKRTKGEA